MPYKIKDIKLSAQGLKNLAWAERQMPVLRIISQDFAKQKPFKGKRIALCLHITKETGILIRLLKLAGAEVYACGSNPLSTQDDIAAALAKEGINIYAKKGISNKEYYSFAESVLSSNPHMLIDDGADLISLLLGKFKKYADSIIGAMEETTTGVVRVRAMEKNSVLKFPVIAVNDSSTKHLFDNHFGTGQSTIDGILRATNIMLAGKVVVVSGFGHCGSGLASALKGLGASVIVTEVEPVKALRAAMEGYRVMPMSKASLLGDIFITVTGNTSVITLSHIESMKDGAIICNSGHFNVEIDMADLTKISKKNMVRENLTEHVLPKGKSIFVLSEGRLVNLASAEGHPSAVMDMSFANQALGLRYLLEKHESFEPKVYRLPEEVDQNIALLKLKSMDIKIDELTPAQSEYLASWQSGT